MWILGLHNFLHSQTENFVLASSLKLEHFNFYGNIQTKDFKNCYLLPVPSYHRFFISDFPRRVSSTLISDKFIVTWMFNWFEMTYNLTWNLFKRWRPTTGVHVIKCERGHIVSEVCIGVSLVVSNRSGRFRWFNLL